MIKKLVCKTIFNISPYQPGKPIEEVAREIGIEDVSSISKLASNENPLGPSPRALEAIRAKLPMLNLYPDGNGYYLKQALAEKLGVGVDQLILGNGSNEILELVSHLVAGQGKKVVYSGTSFAIYMIMSHIFGMSSIEVPMCDFVNDLEGLAAAVTPDVALLFLCNPNNPTGTAVRPEDLDDFLRSLPRELAVILDEAYYEYLPEEWRYDGIARLGDPAYPHLILLRTFSKAYGLAGLRIGYGISTPEFIDVLNRVRQPFNTNSLAQAGALAALGDQEHVEKTLRVNREGMLQLEEGFRRLGLAYVPTFANFILVRVGDGDAVFRRLLARGVIVRPMGGYRLPEYIRVTIGLPEENRRFLRELAAALEQT